MLLRRKLLAALMTALLGLVTVACGGGDDEGDADTEETEAGATETES